MQQTNLPNPPIVHLQLHRNSCTCLVSGRKRSKDFFLHIVVVFIYCVFQVNAFQARRVSRCQDFSSVGTTLAMQGSVYIATSLDGFIATSDGDTSFLEEVPQLEDGDDMGFGKFLASVDVLIMGRKTFQKVLSFGQDVWPYGSCRVVVWSRGDVDIPVYRKSTVESSSLSPTDLFAKLENEGHKRAYIDGGVTVQKFMEAGLVNDICLTTAPILLGDGIKLFGGGKRKKLKHLETKSYKNGMVTSTYQLCNAPP